MNIKTFYEPQDLGPVRVLTAIDSKLLCDSLQSFVDKAQTGIRQQGLRWAGDFEGIGDIRYQNNNPTGLKEKDFTKWIPGTETLQQISDTLQIRKEGRVRMLMMPPKSTYSFHYDPDLWRVHIPLITNSSSFVVSHGKLWHLPLGYAYLVQVEYHHLALNAGDQNRIHIVFDYCDNLA
jgi:hypothetical protein